MKVDYQRKTLTALLAASISLLQPCFSASAENKILLADADSPVGESVLYRPRWSTPATGHIGKLQLAPIVPPQPAADTNVSNPAIPEMGSQLPVGTAAVPSQPIVQAAPAKPKPRGGAPFEWPHADDPPVQAVGRSPQQSAQHVIQPVAKHVAPPIVKHVAPPIAQRETASVDKEEIDSPQPSPQPPLKIQRLTLSSPGEADSESPLPKPAPPRPSLRSAVSNSTLPSPTFSRPTTPPPPMPKPTIQRSALPGSDAALPAGSDAASPNPSAIIPSLSSGHLGETENENQQNSKPTEAPTPGKHNQSAEKLGSPAAFALPAERISAISQALNPTTSNTVIAFDTTSSPLRTVTDAGNATAPATIDAGASAAVSAVVDAVPSTTSLAVVDGVSSVTPPTAVAPAAPSARVDAAPSAALSAVVDAVPATTSKAEIDGADDATLPPANATAAGTKSEKEPIVIESGISIWDTANIDKILETLVDSHFNNSKEAQALDKKVEHYSKAPAKAVAIVKDSLNTSMRIGGTDPSARGGRIVLDENLKITDKATAEYERQRYVDKIHSHIVSALAQIAMGLGTEDLTRRTQIIDSGYKSLSSLVGDDKAKNTVQGLTTWLSRIPVPEETFKKPAWDTMERESKLETVLKAALAKDSVVAEVRKRVYRYAHPGKLKSGTSKVVEGTLATVSWLSPGFAIPIGAEVALDAYIAATGGSEESKLEKEIIYDKRIQSRLKVLDQEATLALDNYRFAIVTKNPSLLAFSEALIADMANAHVANEVLIGQVLDGDAKKQAEQVIPGIKESKELNENHGIKALVKEVVRL
jgi:hypothetical protein